MTPKDWDKFFELLEKIVNQSKTVEEKRDEVQREAFARGDGAEMALDEFTSWDFGI